MFQICVKDFRGQGTQQPIANKPDCVLPDNKANHLSSTSPPTAFFLHSQTSLSNQSSPLSPNPPFPSSDNPPLSLEDLLQECSTNLTNSMEDSFTSTIRDRDSLVLPHVPRNSHYSQPKYSQPALDLTSLNKAVDRLSVDSLNVSEVGQTVPNRPSPSNLYLPLSDVASSGVNSVASPESFYLTLGSDKDGIHPPLSPESTSMANSATSFYLRLNSETEGINPPLSPLASNVDSSSVTYAPLGSVKSGINPPLTPQSMYSDTTYTPLSGGRVPSGINPPLTPLASDSQSGSYVPLSSIKNGMFIPSHNRVHSGINPPLSPHGSTTADYAPLGSVMSGIHPSLSDRGGSMATLTPSLYSEVTNTLQQYNESLHDNPLYRSYDTVNISSDEDQQETKSLDDGQVGDTEDNSDYKKRKDKKAKKEGKSMRKRIKDSFGKMKGGGSDKKVKYLSGVSSEGNGGGLSSDDSSGTFVGSQSSGNQKSEKNQFAAQLSRSIRHKLLSNKHGKYKENRKSDSSNVTISSIISPAEARAKSRSLPLKDYNSVKPDASFSSEKTKSSKSKFVRTLTMPLKMATQKRQSVTRMMLSRSQPTTPEMSRRHRVIQSYTRPRTNTNLFTSSGSFSSNVHKIRDPLSVTHLSSQPASSVRSLFNTKDKTNTSVSSIKHISKPIMVSDPFQRLTSSTKSLMSTREKSYSRPLVKLSPTEGKPPIASRPAPHHSSENIHRIHLAENDSPPFFTNFGNSPIDKSDSQLYLEVCSKCRQNVLDGIQHPSIWANDDYLPPGYVRSMEEQEALETLTKKKGNKEECKIQ